jgi:hypothetical protein
MTNNASWIDHPELRYFAEEIENVANLAIKALGEIGRADRQKGETRSNTLWEAGDTIRRLIIKVESNLPAIAAELKGN